MMGTISSSNDAFPDSTFSAVGFTDNGNFLQWTTNLNKNGDEQTCNLVYKVVANPSQHKNIACAVPAQ